MVGLAQLLPADCRYLVDVCRDIRLAYRAGFGDNLLLVLHVFVGTRCGDLQLCSTLGAEGVGGLVEVGEVLVRNGYRYRYSLADRNGDSLEADELLDGAADGGAWEGGIDLDDFIARARSRVRYCQRYVFRLSDVEVVGNVETAIAESGIAQSVAEGVHGLCRLTGIVLSLAIIHIGVAPVVDIVFHHAFASEAGVVLCIAVG